MSFSKYWQTVKVSWESGFVYRLNFIMWRVRNILQLLTIYFLWTAILKNNATAFNYSQSALLTYIFGTSLMRSIVFSSRSVDAQGEISNGDLNNYLVKPLNYFQYWFSRDIADKALNIFFSIGELVLLFLWLRPPLIIQSSPIILISFVVATLLAMIMYFYFSFLISMTTFWVPEGQGWPQRFLIFMILEFLAGGLFPLDILPGPIFAFVSRLPSAYFLNTPLQIYLGRLTPSEIILSIGIMTVWIILFYYLAKVAFQKGLRIYGAYGR